MAAQASLDEKDRFLGTWKLVSAISEDAETGRKTKVYKGAPVGFIVYGADGRMMTIAVDTPRQKPAGSIATASEAEALFRSMAAYAGTYTIESDRIIHHADVSWNETWTGTDQIRRYKFDGDRLLLATSPSADAFTGKLSVRTLVWEKVK